MVQASVLGVLAALAGSVSSSGALLLTFLLMTRWVLGRQSESTCAWYAGPCVVLGWGHPLACCLLKGAFDV